MKKLIFSLVTVALLASLCSCGVGAAYVFNQNQNSTQVHLAKNNYQLVDKVNGSSKVAYVLIFGGMNKKQLYENAYSEMIKKVDMSGSKALVNVVTEEHIGGVPPFYYERTITVSANVIEFTE